MPRLRKTQEPKAIMTFEVSTLNVLQRYSLCTTIPKSNLVSLHMLIDELDLRAYSYSPDILARLKVIKYICEARTTHNMNDVEVIRTFIINTYPDGKELLDEVDPLIPDTLGFNECNSMSNIISERLQCLYIYKHKDRIIEKLNSFDKGGWTSYYSVVEDIKSELQNLLTNLTASANNRTGLIRRLNMAANDYYDVVDTIVRKAKMPTAILQTGIRQLNSILSPGFQAGALYLILGLTGRFKSGTLLNLADMITKYNPHVKPVEDGLRKTVLFISNENTIEQTYGRLVDMYSSRDDDLAKMSTEEAINFIKENGGYHFTDESGINIDFRYFRNMEMSTADLYTLINGMTDEGYKCIAVVLDYIARVRSVENTSEERFRLANVAKELKAVATYFNIPIITAQQVNREGNGIIDAALRDNKTDLAKFLGSTAVAESYGLIFEADWVCLVNLEKRKSDNKWFLTFNRLKIRGKQDPFAVTYFNHPFVDEKRIRLQPDVQLPQSVSVVSLANDLESVPQDEGNAGGRGYAMPRINGKNDYVTINSMAGKNPDELFNNLNLNGVVAGSI